MPLVTLEDFIRNTIIDELTIMVNTPRLKYLSFIVMSSAIEFLGACIDPNSNTPVDFHAWKPSGERFKLAINKLNAFERYRDFLGAGKNKIDLYVELRCGMIHAVLPKSHVELTERIDPIIGKSHLKCLSLKNRSSPTSLILVCEDLNADIRAAAEEVIMGLRNGNYHLKAIQPVLATDIMIATG
jgi:hypothetical protein